MSDVIYQGWHYAQEQGLLTDGADVRLMLVMGGFTGATEQSAINLADITDLDEFDGLGYQQVDCANVTWTYDATAHEMRLDFDNDEFNAAGGTVTPGSADAVGVVAYLYVDGTDANDIILGFHDPASFPFNGANSAINATVPTDGFMYAEQAP